MVKYSGETDQLSLTFGALADPTRRAMLARLSKGEASVTELAAPFDMSMPAHYSRQGCTVATLPAQSRTFAGSE